MSVGGGFKKGKAEFAMKDIDGNDIKPATESFSYVDGDKVLTVNGIDINSTENYHGLYFKDGEYACNIYPEEGYLVFDCASKLQNEVIFTYGINIQCSITDFNGITSCNEVTGSEKLAYLSCNVDGDVNWAEINDIHCYQFRVGYANFYIYIADYPGANLTNNLYTYLAVNNPTEFENRVNKIVSINANFSSPYPGYSLLKYTITRTGNSPSYIINLTATIIGKDSSGAIDIRDVTFEINSNAYSTGSLVYKF